MKLFLILAFAVILSMSTGCGDDDGTAGMSGAGGGSGSSGASGSGGGALNAERDMVCADLCAVIDALQCANEPPCARDCPAIWDYPGCEAQGRVVLTCGAMLPASAWTCDGMGESTTVSGECIPERNALVACAQP